MKYKIYNDANEIIEMRDSLTDAVALAQGYANADHVTYWVNDLVTLSPVRPDVTKKGFGFKRVQCMTRVHTDDKQQMYDLAATLNQLRESEL